MLLSILSAQVRHHSFSKIMLCTCDKKPTRTTVYQVNEFHDDFAVWKLVRSMRCCALATHVQCVAYYNNEKGKRRLHAITILLDKCSGNIIHHLYSKVVCTLWLLRFNIFEEIRYFFCFTLILSSYMEEEWWHTSGVQCSLEVPSMLTKMFLRSYVHWKFRYISN